MPRNLELKAYYTRLDEGASIARRLRARKLPTLVQSDTYFNVPAGRLKLRNIRGKGSELIWYSRPDVRGKRLSEYTVVKVRRSKAVNILLQKVFGRLVIVRKRRDVFLFKNARIHLDTVEGLGTFVEFEVVVRNGMKQAQRVMKILCDAFRIRRNMCIATSYSTMLMRQRTRRYSR